MKVYIQRLTDGLFLTGEGQWATKDQAKDFKNCTPAIDFCVEHALEDVRLWLSFDDPKYDFPMEVFRADQRIAMRQSKELSVKGQASLRAMELEPEKETEKNPPFTPS